MGKIVLVFFLVLGFKPLKAAAQLNSRPLADSWRVGVRLQVLPQNFYGRNTGFFCKKEVQVQRATTLPLFFRLGSKEYVDYMESKPNAAKHF